MLFFLSFVFFFCVSVSFGASHNASHNEGNAKNILPSGDNKLAHNPIECETLRWTLAF